MSFFIISLTVFGVALLTFFSGFGLGTFLTPVLAVFFPIEIAITLTAIVHFLNNFLKIGLLRMHIDKQIIIKFGFPSIVGAFIGALLLNFIPTDTIFYRYTLIGKNLTVTHLKFIIGIILLIFTFIEIFPIQAKHKILWMGGLLSGFFGGLSGNQGALRSAFLIKTNLNKEQLVASSVAIACMVDITRISVYVKRLSVLTFSNVQLQIVLITVFSAFMGTFVGNKFFKKVTIVFVRNITLILLTILCLLLLAGII